MFKSFPSDEDVVGQSVFERFMTPIAVLSESALAGNIAAMRQYCLDHQVELAPHGKTTMSPELINRQLDAGAWGMTAATAWQAQAMVEFGARRVIIANECLDPVGLRAVAELSNRSGVEIACFVDSIDAVRQMEAVLETMPSAPRIPVLVELGFMGGRCGARGVPAAVRVGEVIADSKNLALIGVAGYEGAIANSRDAHTMTAVEKFLEEIGDVAGELAARGVFDSQHAIVLSAGGSAYFDTVQRILRARRNSYSGPVEIVLRSGCYLVHDHGRYAAVSPPEIGLEAALHVWSRVVSVPEPGLAILDAGRRDLSFDAGMPVPTSVRRGGELVGAPPDLLVQQLNDQHAYVAGNDLAVGDVVALGISHPCTTFDKWRAIPIVDDDHRVLSVARTAF